jgi:hypothetical protein
MLESIVRFLLRLSFYYLLFRILASVNVVGTDCNISGDKSSEDGVSVGARSTERL